MERRQKKRVLGPRPGAFAAVTVALAALSPALYYLADEPGLSYFVAIGLLPGATVVGIVRASRGTRAGDGGGSGGWLSAALGWSAVPGGLVFDLTVLPLGLDGSSLLMRAVVYSILVIAGGLMLLFGTSRRGVKVALGIAALAFGSFTAVALETAGPVVITGPLLLLSALLHRPLRAGTGAG